jgi:hypothetical protein
LREAITLWMARGPEESSPDDAPPDAWDLARVRRRLDRSLVRGAQLLRRARWLALLSDSAVAFREPQDTRARLLVIERGEIALARDLAPDEALALTRSGMSPTCVGASIDTGVGMEMGVGVGMEMGVGVGVDMGGVGVGTSRGTGGDTAMAAGDGPRALLHAPSPHRPRRARQACFDATRYDRLRVLATELRRVHTEGGDVRVQLANRVLAGDIISRLLRAI